MVGTAAERCGFLYRVTAQTSSPSARVRKSSQHSLLALRIARRRSLLFSLTSLFVASPFLRHLLAQPRSLRLALISSFHHRLDLAQMVMTRVSSLRTSTKVDWIHSISSLRFSVVLLSSRMGRVISSLQTEPALCWSDPDLPV